MEGSPELGGDTLRGCRPQGVSPTREVDPDTRGGSQHARWIPTREVDPDTQGGSRQGRSDLPPREVVNHLYQELRPQVFTLLYVSFCANEWLRLADCVVTRSVTKPGGLGACPHSRKRPHRRHDLISDTDAISDTAEILDKAPIGKGVRKDKHPPSGCGARDDLHLRKRAYASGCGKQIA